MDFEVSPRVRQLQQQLEAFMDEHVYPNETVFREQVGRERWKSPPVVEELKAKARAQGLWNLFMPGTGHGGAGLTNLEYAPLAEIMGRVFWAPEIFNCSAPDTGNMEVFARYGTPEQQQKWLTPLLAGEIRSAYVMTEPAVASSDATNVELSIRADGDEYVVNGRKWFATGAMHEKCRIFIVMGKTDPGNPERHLQQSQVLVERGTPGMRIVRPLSTLGYWEEPHGHAEIVFDNVRIPARTSCSARDAASRLPRGGSVRVVSTTACVSWAPRSARWRWRAGAFPAASHSVAASASRGPCAKALPSWRARWKCAGSSRCARPTRWTAAATRRPGTSLPWPRSWCPSSVRK